MKKIIYYYQKLTSTFWFMPMLIILASIALSIITLKLDLDYSFEKTEILNLVLSENAHSGRTVLATIAGAMIGVAGTVFSITLVVLQLASSQFGPRLLQNFMYKRMNQVVLGQYLATFVYCLIVLNAISDAENYIFTPDVSVLVALLFAIFNLILLIFYIHDVCMSIQPSNILNNLKKTILKRLDELYPNVENTIEGKQLEESINVDHLDCIKQFNSHASGYIQYFSIEQLMTFAVKNKVILNILFKPGDYVLEGEPVINILSNNKDAELSEINSDKLFTLDYKRSAFQDLQFGIHQIVEIASKALSPGINDPYTAINCIDNLTDILASITNHANPSAYVFDENNHLRLIVKRNAFSDFLNAAFNQIRHYGADSPAILMKQIESLIQIAQHDKKNQHQDELIRHTQLIVTTAKKNFQLESDIDTLVIASNQLTKS